MIVCVYVCVSVYVVCACICMYVYVYIYGCVWNDAEYCICGDIAQSVYVCSLTIVF